MEKLVEKESLNGDEVREVLEENKVIYFPDPFLEGFGYDEDGYLSYPNRVKTVRHLEIVGQQHFCCCSLPGVARVKRNIKGVICFIWANLGCCLN